MSEPQDEASEEEIRAVDQVTRQANAPEREIVEVEQQAEDDD